MNRTRTRRRALGDLLRIDSTVDFHSYALEHAIGRYRSACGGPDAPLGSVLAVGANRREAEAFARHPFHEILLTGIAAADEVLRGLTETDDRISYRRENCERLSLPSAGFDLVFCKESLHHLARPVLGLYEMLRVCRRAAILIEPYDTHLDRVLRALGLTTVYESNQLGNLDGRDNYVFRWSRAQLESLLNSLYLESGYTLDLTVGWMSSRFNAHRSRRVRRASAIAGWMLGFVPGSRGNYMTALITPGSDLPPDAEAER